MNSNDPRNDPLDDAMDVRATVENDDAEFDKCDYCASGYLGVKLGRQRFSKSHNAVCRGKYEAVARVNGFRPAQSHIGSFATARGAAAAVYLNSFGQVRHVDILTELRLRGFDADADAEERGLSRRASQIL